MRVGVLGGTFDPIHIGHLIIAEEARLKLGLQKVIFMPAGQPRLRASDTHASAEDRLHMAELATADNPYFETCSLEVHRTGTTYTVDTLEELHDAFQNEVSLFFIAGEDILEKFHLWKAPERILQLCTLAVVTRKGAASPDDEGWASRFGCADGAVVRLDSPVIEVSATDIRERIHRKEPLRYLVPGPVAGYILEHNLYQDYVPDQIGSDRID